MIRARGNRPDEWATLTTTLLPVTPFTSTYDVARHS